MNCYLNFKYQKPEATSTTEGKPKTFGKSQKYLQCLLSSGWKKVAWPQNNNISAFLKFQKIFGSNPFELDIQCLTSLKCAW